MDQARGMLQAHREILNNKSRDIGSGTGQVHDNSSQENDVLDPIQKLGDLRDAGILTEEEFVSKKSELLNKL